MIFAEPMKTRSAIDHLNAYKRIHSILIARGLRPQLQRLDNEASTHLKTFLADQKIDYQLVPPHAHRRNQAERAIRVFKNHFIAGLCSTDPNFPLHLWDRLLPQALITLNLLRSSHINPQLSAQELIFGTFNFNRTPLAPPGTKVLIHTKPSVRETWAPHGVDGWYIGPAMEHYRCYRVYAIETQAERIADTLAWFPTKVKMPTASSAEASIAAANDLIHALQNPSADSALSPLSDNQHHALAELVGLFQNIAKTNSEIPSIPPGFAPLTTSPIPDPAPEPRVLDPTEPNESNIPTYTNKTKNPAQRRRQQRTALRKNIANTTPQINIPLAETPTATSPTTIIPIVPIPPAPTSVHQPIRHHHNTRYRALSISAASLQSLAIYTPTKLLPKNPTFFANAVTDPITGATLEYRDLLKGPDRTQWENGWCNEFRRLGPTGTKTIKAIAFHHIPKGRAIGNIRVVAALKPLKAEMHRIRFTIAHHHHDYIGPTSTPTVDMPTVKCHLNSTISTHEARYATIDISDFYLNTILARPEYMRISLKLIPQAIIDEYNLQAYEHKGYIYFQVDIGLYGLVQAGKLAYDQLLKRLTAADFYPAPHSPGLFLHTTRPISFTLCVDDFGIKYINKADIDFLIDTLQSDYKLTIDWTGSNYLGLTLKWNYDNHTVDISMLGYIQHALNRFQHPTPQRPQHSPHSWSAPTYGATTQWAIETDDSLPLVTATLKTLQQILGALLYYARVVDNTMLVAISTS